MIFFRALPVTGSDRNPYQATISTFVFASKNSLGEYLVWGGRDWAPRLDHWKKTRQSKFHSIFMNEENSNGDSIFEQRFFLGQNR